MKSNKGFTLIELLAVIVILAIIALIATPIVLSSIDTAKRGSAKSSALGYVDAVEKSIMVNQVQSANSVAPSDGTYTVGANGATLTKGSGDTAVTINVEFKGDVPTGTVTIASGQVTAAELTFSKIIDKVVTYSNNTATVAD